MTLPLTHCCIISATYHTVISPHPTTRPHIHCHIIPATYHTVISLHPTIRPLIHCHIIPVIYRTVISLHPTTRSHCHRIHVIYHNIISLLLRHAHTHCGLKYALLDVKSWPFPPNTNPYYRRHIHRHKQDVLSWWDGVSFLYEVCNL